MNTPMKKPGLKGDRARTLNDDSYRHSTIKSALAEALGAYGVASLAVVVDGEIHRFDTPDKKRGNLSGWYVCPSHEVAIFGFWHTGEQHTVTLRGEHDPIAAEQARQAADKARRERQQAQARKHAQTARQARQWWRDANPAERRHPYLLAKRVQPHNLRQHGGVLLVPLYADGVLVNLQRIHADGSKRFLPGGRITGAASLIGSMAGAATVYLAEGWATGATIHEASDCPVVVAMSTGNLLPVAKSLRNHLPDDVAIIVAADNDRGKPSNAGMTNGREAALAIGAKIVWPDFPCDGCACSDFNDLAACERREVSV